MTRRRGFSLPELMIVVVITGIMAVFAIPKLRVFTDQNNVAGARARIESAVATARASAIHKGRLSVFIMSPPWISVWSQDPTTGWWQQQVKWERVDEVYPGVQLQVGGAGWWYLYYEPRGITWSSAKPPSTVVFRIVGQTRSDSVCVTRQGQILPRGCVL